MLVRPAQPEDFARIAEIENEAIANNFAHFGTTPVTEQQTEQAYEGRARHPWFIAEEDGQVIGFARASPHKTREAYQWTCEIGIYIHAAHRGKGVGKKLYDALFPALAQAGFRTIIAGVTLPNEASVRLHEAMGMKPIGTFPNVGFKFDEWRSVGYWVVHFGEGPPERR